MVPRSRIQVFRLLAFSIATATAQAAESNWPRWRGPLENGHSTETALPVEWSPSNIVWKANLPGNGQSSPVIWGDQIFLTAALEKGKERLVLCLSQKTGEIVWQHAAWTGEPELVHKMNGWASATCATDGEVLVAFFGRDCPSPIVVGNFIIVCNMAGIATCYDAIDGHVYWTERISGAYSASPIAANGLVYFINEEGVTRVIEPGPTLKVVAENALPASGDEIFRASISPANGKLFIRSTTVLYCIGGS